MFQRLHPLSSHTGGPSRRWLAAIVAMIVVICVGVMPTPASAVTTTTDVVFVHGYGGCQDAWLAGMDPLLSQYYWRGAATSTLHAVDYYGCDTDGESIVEYGPDAANYYPSPDNDYHGTDIRHFGYELAWWLWDKFTSQGKPVDLVGHSMGGLIITYALQRVAAHDPLFPAYLTVPTVATFATPFKGETGVTCPAGDVQCAEMTAGSTFSTTLDAAGAAQAGKAGSPATFWLLIGSEPCDVVPPTTSLALPRATWVADYTSPCYTHTGYVTDLSTAANATGYLNGQAFTNGPHAIALMSWVLK